MIAAGGGMMMVAIRNGLLAGTTSSGSSGLARGGAAAAASWLQQHAAARGSGYATAASAVREVGSDAEFDAAVKALAASNGAAVVDFTAKWCGPCRAVAPLYEQLAANNPSVAFLKVDIDNEQLQRTVMDHGITGVPTFTFYQGARRVETFTGARADLLKATVARLAAGDGGGSGNQ